MPLQPYPYQPIGGINQDDAEDQLDPTELQDARNFLFERKQFFTRPQAVPWALSAATTRIAFVKSLLIAPSSDASPFTFLINIGPSPNFLHTVYFVQNSNPPPLTITPLTGAGYGTVDNTLSYPFNIASVNGILMIAGGVG